MRPREQTGNTLDFLSESWEEGVASFRGKEVEYYKVLELTVKASNTLNRLREPLSAKRIGVWVETVSQGETGQIHNLVERGEHLSFMNIIEERF